MSDFNQQIIEEFRANAGKVSGYFANRTMLLLRTIGAKSGAERVVPLVYFSDNDRIVIVASKGGAPTHPDWYHNLLAHPEVTVEVGTDTYQAIATPLADAARSEAFARVVEQVPGFGEYQEKTTRVIPVVELVKV